ncbi:hypothetical protein N9U01_02350 [Paracoccaceae bacterium]|nr:hypothetical protein [Paracoccaceae bacterium]
MRLPLLATTSLINIPLTTEMIKSPLSGVGGEHGKQWVRLRTCWIARD